MQPDHATLWITLNQECSPAILAHSALQQAIAEEVAESMGLDCRYERDGDFRDLGVSGSATEVAALLTALRAGRAAPGLGRALQEISLALGVRGDFSEDWQVDVSDENFEEADKAFDGINVSLEIIDGPARERKPTNGPDPNL